MWFSFYNWCRFVTFGVKFDQMFSKLKDFKIENEYRLQIIQWNV